LHHVFRISEDALRDFLHREVLARYTHLYRQPSSGAAAEEAGASADRSPDGLQPLREYMQRALAEMQASIESHIYGAMEGGGSGNRTNAS
jgi:hypothetical protein